VPSWLYMSSRLMRPAPSSARVQATTLPGTQPRYPRLCTLPACVVAGRSRAAPASDRLH